MRWLPLRSRAIRRRPRLLTLRIDELNPRVVPAITASFAAKAGILSVFGDAHDNSITVSRDAAGNILVNGGSVAIRGGAATVANTSLIQIFGQGGNDTIALDEANGVLPGRQPFRRRWQRHLDWRIGERPALRPGRQRHPSGERRQRLPLRRGGQDVLTGGSATIRRSARPATTAWSGTRATATT